MKLTNGQLFEVVEIKTEADLPKEDGDYFAEDRIEKTILDFDTRNSQHIKYWLTNALAYLRPLDTVKSKIADLADDFRAENIELKKENGLLRRVMEKQDELIARKCNHKTSCYLKQNWYEAIDALTDTPQKYRDVDWQEALNEVQNKMKTCSCGLFDLQSELTELKRQLSEKPNPTSWRDFTMTDPLPDECCKCGHHNSENCNTCPVINGQFDGC